MGRGKQGSLIALCAGLALAFAAPASAVPAPKGEVILEVTGEITEKNGPNGVKFDRATLEALGMKEIVTTTPWHQGSVRFEGVPLDAIMKAVGATGRTVKAVALNDYTTLIPVEDFARHGAILALKKDGEYMSVRDKGPLFVIYPYDSDPALKSQMYYARSAWQVARLEVQR